jgi:type II secretory pathway predicted ATPase ExeA
MYEAHFGLKAKPFPTTPDAARYYAAAGHEAAMAELAAALGDGAAAAVLTAVPGLGKTLLCRRLVEQLAPEAASAMLTNTHVPDPAALLQAILFELSLPYEGRREQELRLVLTEHLLTEFGAGRRLVLIVDEAQHLREDCLEELRMLGNLEGPRGKAVQVVLAGQPALGDTLERPELVSLRQRSCTRVTLSPLPSEEASDYLAHHLRLAGARPDRVMSEEAFDVLARGTGGVPRLLNHAAHQALVLAYRAAGKLVDAEAALGALELLGLEMPPDPSDDGDFDHDPVVLSTEKPANGRVNGTRRPRD